jgi:beta-lactamase superfamily II metal-dependent hydrolase
MFDNGVVGYCNLPINYLDKLGVREIDYHVASHYHEDHIGCTSKILDAFPLTFFAVDRGDLPFSKSLNSPAFKGYEKAVRTKREQASPGEMVTLDTETDNPVVITFVAMNGAGVVTDNENDLSLVAVISFGNFRAVMGGDLSGFNASGYKDIERLVAEKVGPIDLYKVHHHCSKYSTSEPWLKATKPKVATISASENIGPKDHGHPTSDCLKRLHGNNVKCYWTQKRTDRPLKPEWDSACGNIVVEVGPNMDEFQVICNGSKDSYPVGQP